jgi:hypothetical protein
MNSEETKIDVILKSILETLEKESGSDWKSVKISESHRFISSIMKKLTDYIHMQL